MPIWLNGKCKFLVAVTNKYEISKVFEDCFRQYFKSLCFYVMTFVKDEEAAKDIVHDVFMSVWSHRGDIDFSLPMYPYLLNLARNHSLNYVAHQKVKSRHEAMLLLKGEISVEPDAEGHEELVRNIMDSIDRLPVRCREVMRLCFVECKRYKEIAELLGISVNTVKTHIMTGLKTLRDEYPVSLLFMFILKKLQGKKCYRVRHKIKDGE